MISIIEELPEDVLEIEATGKVTHADYQNILIPAVEKSLAKGPLKLLYVIGSEFTDFEPKAIMNDTALGLKHWRDFPYIALVTDIDWIKNAARLFAPFFPGEIRLFSLSERASARAWILSTKIPANV